MKAMRYQVSSERALATVARHFHTTGELSEGDAMFAYALGESGGNVWAASLDYLRCGLAVMRVVDQLVGVHFGEFARVPSLLDFASGAGRLTRFLAPKVSPGCLYVSDIQASVVAFQKEQLGVRGFVSCEDPEALEVDRQFGAVMAFSFFSHLPQGRFEAWLERLWSLVEPIGFLVFSTHDVTELAASEPGHRLDDLAQPSFYFAAESDVSWLDVREYGTTWVSESYVTELIERACPGARAVRRYQRALWDLQDLYVVSRQRYLPDALDAEPLGYLEMAESDGAELALGGWAIAPGRPREPLRVALWQGVRCLAEARAEGLRVDVASRYGDAYRFCGWRLSSPVPTSAQLLTVRARPDRGYDTTLFVGPLADLTASEQRLRERVRRAHSGRTRVARAAGQPAVSGAFTGEPPVVSEEL